MEHYGLFGIIPPIASGFANNFNGRRSLLQPPLAYVRFLSIRIPRYTFYKILETL